MHYLGLNNFTITDGPYCRVSLYVSGCRNHCKGCHNKVSWDFNAGDLFTEEVEQKILEWLKLPYIKGFSICGGEPMEEENQRSLLPLLQKIRKNIPDKDIWLWTGYEFEDLLPQGRKHCEVTEEILSLIDVAIVGPFILEQRDITGDNLWRGSRNQRVIDIKQSLKLHKKIFLLGIPNNK